MVSHSSQIQTTHTLRRGTPFLYSIYVLPRCAGGSLPSSAHQYLPLDVLCDVLCNLTQEEELKYDSITDPQQVRWTFVTWTICVSTQGIVIPFSLQSLSHDLLIRMATALSQNNTLKVLELRSDALTQYNDAKLFTQYLMSGVARSTSMTQVCIGFSSWWRDCHIKCEWATSCFALCDF